jgi:hypothetical protein
MRHARAKTISQPSLSSISIPRNRRVGHKQRGPRVAERRERGRRLGDGEGVGRGDGRHALAFEYV